MSADNPQFVPQWPDNDLMQPPRETFGETVLFIDERTREHRVQIRPRPDIRIFTEAEIRARLEELEKERGIEP